MIEKKSEYCTWIEGDHNVWYTNCRHMFQLDPHSSLTPLDNLMDYCCFCGRKLTEKHADDI